MMLVIGYLGYRLRKVYNVEDYYCQMKKSTKPYTHCSQIMVEKFKDYDPWKCYLKAPIIKTESCTQLSK